MNNDREMFWRLVETAHPAQAAHLDSLHSERRRRAGPGIVPAAALLGMTVLLVVATIAAMSAASNFLPDNQVAQTDATATALPADAATTQSTRISAGEPTATAQRRQATATPSTVPPAARIAFPQHPQGSHDPSMEALIRGRLVERDGCLWIGDGLVIWPRDYSLVTSGERARVLNGEGRVAARVGDYVTGGGGVAEGKGAAPVLREQGVKLPAQCQGPYLIMGGLRAATGTPTADYCIEPTKDQLGVTEATAKGPKLSFEQMIHAADHILIGTVESIDIPRWNTVDGCYEEWNDVGIMLYKPVRLDVGRVITDKVGVPSDVEYALFDERLGDIGQRGAEDPPQLVKGRKYLFFSRPSLNRQTEQDTSLMILEQAYPLDDRNRVIVGPGDVRPLERAVEDILRVSRLVDVGVQCGGQGRESVTIINQTDRQIMLSSISGSHYDRKRNRVVTHDEAKLNITLDPGEKHTHRPSERTFFSGHSEGEHSYESALVVTSFGSAAVPCGNSTSFTEGQRIQQKVPARVTFRLTLGGEARQGASSFDLLGSWERSHDMVLTGVFCGKMISGPEAISKAPCEGGGKVYTLGPFEYFAVGDRIDFSIRRQGAGGTLETVLEGPMGLTERDTVIDAQYDYP